MLVREGVWTRRDERTAEPSGTRCGFVALIGAPNAGKSTLLNRLVGTKVVDRQPQGADDALDRARHRDRGEAQIVFVDTPGIFKPKRRLDRAMVDTAWGGARDADIVALLIDAAKGIDDEAQALLDRLGEIRQPKVLLLNKIDTVKRESLLALADAANKAAAFDRTFMISALTGDGLDDFMAFLAERRAGGPVPLSGGRGQRHSAAPARRRDHPREAVRAAAPGTALSGDGRDRSVDRPEGRLGARRADHLCDPRQPEEDRHRQGRRHHQGDLHGGAQGARPRSPRSRSTSSSSSRCARTGPTTRNATAPWGSSSPRGRGRGPSSSRLAAGVCVHRPNG